MPQTDADVLVIGAGLTGAVIAAELAARGLRVAVVDAQRAGKGATQMAAGLVMADPGQAEATQPGADELIALAVSHGVATRRFDAALVDAGDTDHPRLAVRATWPAAWVNLAALAQSLLRDSRIIVREEVEIHGLETVDGVVHALAEGYTVRAPAVVLATGAYTGLLARDALSGVTAVRAATWLSQPIEHPVLIQSAGQPLPLPVFLGDGSMMAVQQDDGALRVCAVQPWGEPANDPIEITHRFLRRYLHEFYERTERWMNGVCLASADGAPLARQVEGQEHVWLALCGGPFAPAWTPIVAERISAMI